MQIASRRALGPLAAAGALFLAGCAGFRNAAGKLIAKVPITDAEIIDVWGIAKGIGLVALTTLAASDPEAAAILAAIKLAQPLVDQLSTLATDELKQAAVSTIQAQANIVLLNGAPKITAEPNSPQTPLITPQ